MGNRDYMARAKANRNMFKSNFKTAAEVRKEEKEQEERIARRRETAAEAYRNRMTQSSPVFTPAQTNTAPVKYEKTASSAERYAAERGNRWSSDAYKKKGIMPTTATSKDVGVTSSPSRQRIAKDAEDTEMLDRIIEAKENKDTSVENAYLVDKYKKSKGYTASNPRAKEYEAEYKKNEAEIKRLNSEINGNGHQKLSQDIANGSIDEKSKKGAKLDSLVARNKELEKELNADWGEEQLNKDIEARRKDYNIKKKQEFWEEWSAEYYNLPEEDREAFEDVARGEGHSTFDKIKNAFSGNDTKATKQRLEGKYDAEQMSAFSQFAKDKVTYEENEANEKAYNDAMKKIAQMSDEDKAELGSLGGKAGDSAFERVRQDRLKHLADKYGYSTEETEILAILQEREQNKIDNEEYEKLLKPFLEKHPWLAWAATSANILGGTFYLMGQVGDTADAIRLKELGYEGKIQSQAENNPLSAAYNLNTINQEVNGDRMGGWYNRTNQIANNLLMNATGRVASALMFFSSGYAGGVNEATANGADFEHAQLTGAAQGANEMIFEKLSWGSLGVVDRYTGGAIKSAGIGRALMEWLPKVALDMGINGLEEVNTDIANDVADYLINGDFSRYALEARSLLEEGYSQDEVNSIIGKEIAKSYAETFKEGALQGGFMAGGYRAISEYNARRIGKQAQKYGYTNQILQNAEIAGGEAKAYKDAAIQQAGGEQNLSPAQIGRIVRETQNRALADETARENINKSNEEYNSKRIADAVFGWKSAEKGVSTTGKTTITESGETVDSVKIISADRDLSKDDKGNVQWGSSTADIKVEVKTSDGKTRTMSLDDLEYSNEAQAKTVEAIEMAMAQTDIDSQTANFILNTLPLTIKDNSSSQTALAIVTAYNSGKYDIPIGTYGQASVRLLGENVFETIRKSGAEIAAAQTSAQSTAIKAAIKSYVETGGKAINGKAMYKGQVLTDKLIDSDNSIDDIRKGELHMMKLMADATGARYVAFESTEEERKSGDAPDNGYFVYDENDGEYVIYVDLNSGNKGQGIAMYTLAHELTHFIKTWSPEQFNNLAKHVMARYAAQDVNVEALVDAEVYKAAKAGIKLSREMAYEEVICNAMQTMLTDSKQTVVNRLADLNKENPTLFNKLRSEIDRIANNIAKKYKRLSKDRESLDDAGRYIYDATESIEELRNAFAEALNKAGQNFKAAGGMHLEDFKIAAEAGKETTITNNTNAEEGGLSDGDISANQLESGSLIPLNELVKESDSKRQMIRSDNEPMLKQRFIITGSGKKAILYTENGKVKKVTVKELRNKALREFFDKDESFNRMVREKNLDKKKEIDKRVRNLDKVFKNTQEFLEKVMAENKYTFVGLEDCENQELVVRYDAENNPVEIVLSAMVNNGEYEVNFDFTKVCERRQALQGIINELTKKASAESDETKEVKVNLTQENIFAINKALSEMGIDTACLICFVESKRYNIQNFYQDMFINVWNNAVKEEAKKHKVKLKDIEYFRFAERNINSEEGKLSPEEVAQAEDYAAKWRAQKGELSAKAEEDSSDEADEGKYVEKLIKSYVQQAAKAYFAGETTGKANEFKLLQLADLVTEDGRTRLHRDHGEIETLIGQRLGTSAPKSVEAYTPYNGEIELLEGGKTGKTKDLAEYLLSIGGIRSQSFSDYVGAHLYDVLQKTCAMSARGFSAHTYTKEIYRAILFGMTGEKTNMSAVYEIKDDVDSWNAGLRYNENGELEYAISDYDAKKSGKADWNQSIRYKEAVALQNTEGYSKNCGIIGVGHSWNHQMKMQSDPEVRMIIGYHRSSLPVLIAELSNISKSADYTNVQNTLSFKGFTKNLYNTPDGVPSYATPPMDNKYYDENGNQRTGKSGKVAKNGIKTSESYTAEEFTDAQALIERFNENCLEINPAYNSLSDDEKLQVETDAAVLTLNQLLTYANENGLRLKTSKAEASKAKGHEINIKDGDTFHLYEDLAETKDPYLTAQHYIRACIKNGMIPEFYEFTHRMNEDGSLDYDFNYYKNLYDFNVIDRNADVIAEDGRFYYNDGSIAYAPQEAVNVFDEDGNVVFDKPEWYEQIDASLKDSNTRAKAAALAQPKILARLASQVDSSGKPLVETTKKRQIRDTEYFDAIEKYGEDSKEVAKMTERAAFEWGAFSDYKAETPIDFYHGTPNGGFTVFGGAKTRNGADAAGSYWFTENDREHAGVYRSYPGGAKTAENPMTYKVWIKAGNYADIGNGRVMALDYERDGAGAATKELKAVAKAIAFKTMYNYQVKSGKWLGMDEIEKVERRRANQITKQLTEIARDISADFIWQVTETKEFADLCVNEGLDGVIAWEQDKGYNGTEPRMVKTYGVFNRNDIKSADPVTYDDQGNIIPLSERFKSDNKDIRYQLRDSDGNELSKAQTDFFKNSKIRDENGNLLVVYHGTDEDFTVFDKTKGRSTMDIQGMFFSPWEIDAGGYGKNVGKYYLNITNPAPEDVAYKALNMYKGQNNAGVKAREYLEKLGYDGVNNGNEEYIAFNSNQIKRVDNLNPTMNEDTRHQFRGWTADGYEVYETDKNLKGLPNAEKIELFRDEFYKEGSSQYLGRIVRFLNNGKYEYAEIDKDTAKKNTGKKSLSSLNSDDKTLINVGASGDFVTLIWEADRKGRPSERNTSNNNDAHKNVISFDYYVKTVYIDDVPYDVHVNVRNKNNGGRFVYNVKLNKNKKLPQLGPQTKILSHRHRMQSTRNLGSFANNNTNNKKSQGKKQGSHQLRETVRPDDILSSVSPEELEAIESEVDRRMAEKDEEVVSLNKQIADLTKQRNDLLKDEKANHDEIVKLNNRIGILRDRLEKRREQVVSLQGKLRRGDAKVDRLTEQMKEARAAERTAVVRQRVYERHNEIDEHEAEQTLENASEAEMKQIVDAVDRELLGDAMGYGRMLGEQKRKTEQKVKEQRRKDVEYYHQRMREIRADRDQKLMALKMLQYQKEVERKEFSKRQDYKGRIIRKYEKLQKMLLHPTENQHVPADLVHSIADFLEYITPNFLQEQYRKDGTTIKKREKNNNRLMDLVYAYGKIKEEYEDVYDEEVYNLLQEASKSFGNKSIDEMDSYELSDINNLLGAIEHTIRRANKAIVEGKERDAYALARNLVRQSDDGKKKQSNFFKRFLWAQLNPYSVFHAMSNYEDGGWMDMYKILNEGQLRKTQIQVDVVEAFKDLMNNKELDKLSDYKNGLVDIGLIGDNNQPVKITRDFMLALYLHLQNEQNRNHIAEGGLTIPDFEKYYKGDMEAWGNEIVRTLAINGDLFRLHMEQNRLRELKRASNSKEIKARYDDDIAELENQMNELRADADRFMDDIMVRIESQLTDYERKFIDKARWFFNEYSKDKLNEATMQMYGFKKAREDNYMPIITDSDFLNAQFESVVRDASLENMGFMKERVKGANNAIKLFGLTDVINAQLNKVSKYAGLAPAIKEFNNVYNKKFFTDGRKTSVQEASKRRFGVYGQNYIEYLLADLQGGRKAKGSTKIFSQLRGNSYQAALLLNARVALAQTGSYPTAAAEVGWKPLRKALLKGGKDGKVISKADRELIDIYTPLLANRFTGGSSTDITNVKNTNLHTLSGINNRILQRTRAVSDWISMMDTMTVGRLWSAAEYYVDEHYNLEKGTEEEIKNGQSEYYKKVAEVFNRIVERTQPSYTTMQRPELLRNPNEMLRMFTMFMTQRSQNFNLVYDSVGKFLHEAEKKKSGVYDVTEYSEAKSAMGRAVASQAIAGVTLATMKALVDAIQHNFKDFKDDDDDITILSVLERIFKTFLESEVSNMIGGSELFSFIESAVTGSTYYGITANVAGSIEDMSTAISNLFKSGVNAKTLTRVATTSGMIIGLPASQLKKWIEMFVAWGTDIANGEFDSE